MLEVVVVCKKVACGGGMGFVEQYARRVHVGGGMGFVYVSLKEGDLD